MRIRSTLFMALLIVCSFGISKAQTNASDLYNTALSFMRSSDYSNAILVLNHVVELAPENAQYRKQLAYAYYLNNNFQQAEVTIKQVLNSDAADVQTYQIAGDIYVAENDPKTAEKNYKKGLKKFPDAGELYNELGIIYYNERKYTDALQTWLTGIKVNPDYASNYYNAAKIYYSGKDKVWTVLYGEIFINLERYTARTAEMKGILLAAYKDLFTSGSALNTQSPALDDKGQATVPDFKQAFLNALSKGSGTILARGITPQTLVMLRTRFILSWDNFYKYRYPFALFDFQQQLLKEGLFEAYNEWLFGPASNLPDYKYWVNKHPDEMNRLISYLNDYSLKPQPEQYYHQKGKVNFEPANLSQ